MDNYFDKNDWLIVTPVVDGVRGHYPAGNWVEKNVLVVAQESGHCGGLDVYDVLYREEGTSEYVEKSIYGFQIKSLFRFKNQYLVEESSFVEDYDEGIDFLF